MSLRQRNALEIDRDILDCVRIRADLTEQLRERNPATIDATYSDLLRRIADQNERIHALEREKAGVPA